MIYRGVYGCGGNLGETSGLAIVCVVDTQNNLFWG